MAPQTAKELRVSTGVMGLDEVLHGGLLPGGHTSSGADPAPARRCSGFIS